MSLVIRGTLVHRCAGIRLYLSPIHSNSTWRGRSICLAISTNPVTSTVGACGNGSLFRPL